MIPGAACWWAFWPAARRASSMRSSRSASACRPSSPRSACSISPAASPPGSSPASSSPAFPRASTCSAARSTTSSTYFGIAAGAGLAARRHRGGQRPDHLDGRWSPCIAGIVLGYTPFGQKVYATGGNRRAADYAGINTNRVRFIALVFSRALRGHGGHHLCRLLPQLQSDRRPVPRARRHRRRHHRRRLDLRRLRHDHRLARRRGRDHA